MPDSTTAARSIKGPVWVGGDFGRRSSWADAAAGTAEKVAGTGHRVQSRCDLAVAVRLVCIPGDGSAGQTMCAAVGHRSRG
jgi:hypothetical protein